MIGVEIFLTRSFPEELADFPILSNVRIGSTCLLQDDDIVILAIICISSSHHPVITLIYVVQM